MLRKIVEECFSDLKDSSPPEAKRLFGFIWAVFASKRVRFREGDIFMSWRDLSAQLATIYNEWYQAKFTTDAFYRAVNPNMAIGDNDTYDEMMMRVYRQDNCLGIFVPNAGPPVRHRHKTWVYTETDIITGEKLFYKQGYEQGRCVGNPERISAEDFEKLCFSEG